MLNFGLSLRLTRCLGLRRPEKCSIQVNLRTMFRPHIPRTAKKSDRIAK